MEDAGVGFGDFIDKSKGPASSVSGGPVSGVSTLCLISVDCSLRNRAVYIGGETT